MLESLLVADHGLGAARVLRSCRRLGIKSVLAGLSDGSLTTDASHLADDVVLLADAGELNDPTAVVRAAQAAGVEAIHGGYGALRGDARLVSAARAAHLRAIVTVGIGARAEVEQALRAEKVTMSPPGVGPTRWVYVFGTSGRIVVLGSVRADPDGLVVAGDDDLDDVDHGQGHGHDRGERAGAHRLAHAAAAVLGVDGLAAVAVAAGGVVEVLPGLPDTHAVWELVTDLDLVELQLDPGASDDLDVTTGGVAVGQVEAQRVTDVRPLDALAQAADADGGGLRLDAVALIGSPHGALVRASAWAEDAAAARTVLRRYDDLVAPPA